MTGHRSAQEEPAAGLNGAFDHRDPGTGESAWSAESLWAGVEQLELGSVRRLVVVAAHPDDETLGAGGLMAEAAGMGIAVAVLVISAGERSHPDSPTHSPAALAVVRRAEVRRAISVLAPDAVVRQLAVPDGEVAESVDAVVAELASLVGDDAAATLIVAPWRGDRHPDHAAAAAAAAIVARSAGSALLEYPVWAWHWATPGDGTLTADMFTAATLSDESRLAKETALSHHVSQLRPLSDQAGDEAVVHEEFLAHFRRPVELFVDHGRSSLDRGFFDDFYGESADPWGFEDRWYEERKRALTLGSLPRRRFRSAFEPGCSVGVLTAELATRCDHVLAVDISPAPLRHAQRRLAGVGNVHVRPMTVPREWPPGSFDLIVFSEIGYYCSPSDLSMMISSAVSSLSDDGVLAVCHWRHPVRDYPMSGDQVHATVRRESGLAVLVEHVEEDFLLDILVRQPARSVARAEGLVS